MTEITVYSDEHLSEVANIWREGAKSGRPTAAVEAHFTVPRSTAGRWVARARAAGHLPPTTPGSRPLLRKPSTVAAAAELGVTYEALEAALRAHGPLRVRRVNR